jgi:hypothetical protein
MPSLRPPTIQLDAADMLAVSLPVLMVQTLADVDVRQRVDGHAVVQAGDAVGWHVPDRTAID